MTKWLWALMLGLNWRKYRASAITKLILSLDLSENWDVTYFVWNFFVSSFSCSKQDFVLMIENWFLSQILCSINIGLLTWKILICNFFVPETFLSLISGILRMVVLLKSSPKIQFQEMSIAQKHIFYHSCIVLVIHSSFYHVIIQYAWDQK